jgi:DNA-binding LacI/PurR family transcriptional regulator
VIAYTDLMARGLVRAPAARGLRVPDDLSVVGLDGVFAAGLVVRASTSRRRRTGMLVSSTWNPSLIEAMQDTSH